MSSTKTLARVLAIAGSDSGGGAGIQADIKTITALGGFATTAISAITVQNSLGVGAVMSLTPALVRAQIEAVLSDIGTDAIKTGMLADPFMIETIARTIAPYAVPLVVDPVMIATSGARLSSDLSVQRLIALLFPMALLVTPNLPEASTIAGFEITARDQMETAARLILDKGPQAVLLKGGHLAGDRIVDLLLTRAGAHWFEDDKIITRHTHGTGCTLASAIATGLGQQMTLLDAVTRARLYLRRAIDLAPGFGAGHGPIHHGHPFQAE